MLYVTAQDLQDTLVRMLGGNSSPEEVLDVRRAIRQALRTVSASHVWPCYHDFYRLTTDAPYDTGTLTYTASTRVATLSGGTFPSWAAAGVLVIDSTLHARVQTRTSGTSVLVSADDAPADDFSGSYSIYRYQYELSADLNLYKFGKPQVDQVTVLEYVPPDLFETDVRLPYLVSGSKPRCFTISRGRTAGRTCLSLWPYPSEALRLRFGYLRHPRDVRTWDYSTGTVSTASASAAVTGSGTSFSSTHQSCLLRTGGNRNDLPTHRDGRNPCVDEVVVSSIDSATALTAAEELSATATDVAYTLSDILDYDVNQMHEVVLYAARLELSKLRSDDVKVRTMHREAYESALYYAKCQSGGANVVGMAGRGGRIAYPGLWDSYMTFGG